MILDKSGKTFRDRFKSADIEIKIAYIAGIAFIILFTVAMVMLQTKNATDYLLFSGKECKFRTATGLYCPGCGGTRAVVMLSRLRILDSFKYHALVPVTAIMFFISMIIETLHLALGTKGLKAKHFYIMLSIFVATLVVRWVVVNILIISMAI